MKFFSETSSHRPPSTFLTSYFGISICILQPCPAVIHKSLRFNLNAIQNQAHVQCDGFNIGEGVQTFNRSCRDFGKAIYRDLNQSRLDIIIPLVNDTGPKGLSTNCSRLSKIPVGENNHGCQADLPRIGTKNQRASIGEGVFGSV